MNSVRSTEEFSGPARIAAEQMPRYLPHSACAGPTHWLHPDVQMQVYTHRSTLRDLVVPAVAEPLLVLVMSGAARVEERERGQGWRVSDVAAGDFFLTRADEPYEMRWQTTGIDDFKVVHLYLSQRLLDLAATDIQQDASQVHLLELSGANDAHVERLVRCIYEELAQRSTPSVLCAIGLAQALAVHLVRQYRDDAGVKGRNALPAYRLQRVIRRMQASLDTDLSMPTLAQEAGLSRYYFSRLFQQATGHSPSQFFIQLRMTRARELLSSTDQSIIQVALDVGYGSPAHFAQVFRRHTGMTPREYRNQ
ncbi:helix-turn-helix domain-containing protein [Pseudomonas allii]|uniref:Helix-turn-helix domain-containing protein n=1 Tax=Pseudomonas allii TaxID=2740531 RepID=A0ACC6LAX1_9PSED|nr:helix-turn-helix domain-containing protein [Pseudomonas allii]MDR9875331.1 helix-turn-helix domain-containing protein [Pseudomonas allii]